ncbi:ComEC/Rec2 family competence protein [Pararhodobacter sp.]|uniref:ComEC/Rec2 family competence protein n=1 Tax=Pararhodobacter sp. TaxID=2127056 RepID=UPI002FDD7301
MLPLAALGAARGHLFPFVPVLLAVGIGLYFALPSEPPLRLWAGLALLCAGLAAFAVTGPEALRIPALALALVLGGALLAGWRAHSVAAPVLGWRYYGPVEGRIVTVDRSVSDALRLTLDQVVLHNVAVARVPLRVRVSIHGEGPEMAPVPGTRVILTGHLGPPGGPVEPGGFDFRRLAWFDQLGAVGYTRSPVLALEAPAPGAVLAITRLRMRMSAGIRAAMPGEPGGFVAAILTGDRSGVGQATTEALRRSNLAHLLAISGLHMGLLTGVVYGALRAVLALIPVLALRWPIRKWAALGALAAAIFYLLLSGGNVATQRAFVMAAVMLGAVLFDRRALSLRSVALAAMVILIWRPEALLSPGFQMSFAATVALVAVFGWMRRHRASAGQKKPRAPRWLRAVAGVALCSLVAGVATAPVAAAHFHRIAEYGLVANLLSVPLMGTLVMPAAVLAAVLWPVGLDWIGLALMEAGTRWILMVAHGVAGLEGAVRSVTAPPAVTLPVLALGCLWLILWPGRARFLGVFVAVAGIGSWGLSERPALLIADSGALVGVLGPQGRALTRPRGEGFVARNWLESDGDAADQAQAAARLDSIEGGAAGFSFAGAQWVHLVGRHAPDLLSRYCRPGVVIVVDFRLDGPVPGGCQVIDTRALAVTGARAASFHGTEVLWRHAHQAAGDRPWTRQR